MKINHKRDRRLNEGEREIVNFHPHLFKGSVPENIQKKIKYEKWKKENGRLRFQIDYDEGKWT